jgi:AmmeMemoRadiSam system protein B
MTLGSIRSPAVAGSFYPESPQRLAEAVQSYLAAAEAPADAAAPKALIAPHAGYVYSGPTAGVAYARIAPARERIERVVLLGPAHRVPVAGLAAPGADAFATPLGEIPLDRESLERLLELPQVSLLDAAHALEHSLEVQLPFLQTVLGGFSLVPLVVGEARPEEVAQVLESVWNGPETLIVVSSDLSHYQGYAAAQRMDAATARAIEALRPQEIRYDDACGRVPIQGLLVTARRKGLRAHTLDVRNSGDTAGPRDTVVGYGAWAFE